MPDTGSGTGTPITTPAYSLQGYPFSSAVWLWDNSLGAYVDNTVEAQTQAGTVFSLFTEAADYHYFGSESRFDLLLFLMTTIGTVGALTWQYSMADRTWRRFIPRQLWNSHDGSYMDYAFSVNGAVEFPNLRDWASFAFSATNPHAAAPPDTSERFWIRVSTASVTTSPTINQVQLRPYAVYCTPSDVSKLLQLDYDFDETTTPTRNTVEDAIATAQSKIDYATQKSWRLNYRHREHYEFGIAGIRLMRRDVRYVTELRVWNGQDFELKNQGRNLDYFFIPDKGVIYFSRYFLLPARLQSYNAPVWRWGWAEFTDPVQISYIYGRDVERDVEQGRIVFDIARKLTAIDILQHHDYSILASPRTDRVALDRKVEVWREEVEKDLDSLRGWTLI